MEEGTKMDSEISLNKAEKEDIVNDIKVKAEDIPQIVKNVRREEDETDGGFIKVEKESLDGKDGPLMSSMASPEKDKPLSMERSFSGSSREVLEAQEKIKELELELERVTIALKDSESENTKLKDEAFELKEKLQEGGKKHEELKFDHKKLQEQMTEAEKRHGLHLNSMQEALQAQEAKHKELVEVKDAFSGLSLELQNSRKRMQELQNELQLSSSEAKKLEELHKQSCSHAESETARALELERLLDVAKASAKETEGQLVSLQEELNGLYVKIAENQKVEEALQSTAMELSGVKEELALTNSQLVDMKQEFSSKEALVSELTQELDMKKASESQLREDILALKNLLTGTIEDLQGKVSEFEELKLKLREESCAREKFESGLKTQEAQFLIAEEEMATVEKEKKVLGVMVTYLTKNAAQLKELCEGLEEKLKLSDENFHKADSLLYQALSNNAELELKLKSVEELHSESGAAVATTNKKNLELEDLIRASKEAAEQATSQLREWETRCIAAEQRNVELEQKLNLVELKSNDTERELQEITEKLSALGTAFEKIEEEKKLLNDQLQEHQEKGTHLESVIGQSSSRNLELEEELKVSLVKCAEHEDRAKMSHQRSLELEDLFQVSHSKAEDAGKKVNELELLLETEKYRIQELEEQIGTLERKCMDAEADSQKFSDKVSELTSELEAFQAKASSLEAALQLANEKEKEFTELLNHLSNEKGRLEEESSASSKQLFESENLVQVLHNELNVVQEKLEMIENEMKTAGLRETDVLAKLKSAEEQLENQEILIVQATSSKSELEAMHESLKRDSELKLQEVATTLSNRESESKFLIENIMNLEDQVKSYEVQVAEAAGRYAMVKEELDHCLVKVASMVESNEELKKQISEAETKASNSLSENELLVETNNQLKLKINELQELLSAATTEKETTAQQLASHLSTITDITDKHSRAVELHSATEAQMVQRETELREAIQKLNEIDVEKKDLAEKLNSLQEQIRSYENQASQESAIAESRRVELDETLLKLKGLESAVEDLKTRSDHFEKESAGLAEANLRLTQKLALYENNLSDLEARLSVAVSEKLEAIEQFHTSKKAADDLTQQLGDEGQKLQLQISSVLEENNLLNETYQNAKKELQSVIVQLEEQLKEQKNNEDALKSEVENLKADNAEKSALQTHLKELEEKLVAAEDQLKQEKKLYSEKEIQKEAAQTKALEDLESKNAEVLALEGQLKELQQKLKVADAKLLEKDGDAISVEHTKDGIDIKSRDIGSAISAPTRRKSRKKLEEPARVQTSSPAQTSEVSPLMNLKFISGVVLVSILIGIFLGKRY